MAMRGSRWLLLLFLPWLGVAGACRAQDRLLPLAAVRSGLEFAGGDVKRGADTVIWAIQEGHEAATSIDRYSKDQDLATGRAPAEKSKYEIDLDGIAYIPRTAMPALPVAERRNNFQETETGFDDAMARREAERCLKCGICSECMECVKACRAKAVDHSQTVTFRDLNKNGRLDIYEDPRQPVEARVEDLLSQMKTEYDARAIIREQFKIYQEEGH